MFVIAALFIFFLNERLSFRLLAHVGVGSRSWTLLALVLRRSTATAFLVCVYVVHFLGEFFRLAPEKPVDIPVGYPGINGGGGGTRVGTRVRSGGIYEGWIGVGAEGGARGSIGDLAGPLTGPVAGCACWIVH